MKTVLVFVLMVWLSVWSSSSGYAQGEIAVRETFFRYAPAVYSISVEIPKEIVVQRLEKSLTDLRKYAENFTTVIANTAGNPLDYSVLENSVSEMEKQLDVMRESQATNKMRYVSGVGFAVHPHYLVTLSTVVQSVTEGGQITLYDNYKREINANIKGVDTVAGIAVLSVDDVTFPNYVDITQIPTPLPETTYVMSIQRPYELPASPFSGMIGGYFRRTNWFELEQYIQSSVPLYPGNEGAPVFSPSGRLVGMIAGKYQVEGWPGISFLIPSEMVIDSAMEIIQSGARERGWIPGLDLQQSQNGILVQSIDAKSPAVKAGLKKGDLIIGFQDKEMKNKWQFLQALLETKPNQIVKIWVQRDNTPRWVHVKTEVRGPAVP
ncbi:MAG: S1C family serine protease [bacterium]|nr:S1C family serine protease [bacterium]